MQCIFCKIVKREIDSAKIYEDDDILAFLDVHPFSKGHTLVIPKKHFENIFDIDKDILQKVIIVTKNISEKIRDSLNADGIRLSQSNGSVAGQEMMHFHLHVIPRYKDDGLSSNPVTTSHSNLADFEELKKLAEQIKIET